MLDRNFTPEAANQVWTRSIIYIAIDEGWLYLTGVIDLFSRQVVNGPAARQEVCIIGGLRSPKNKGKIRVLYDVPRHCHEQYSHAQSEIRQYCE